MGAHTSRDTSGRNGQARARLVPWLLSIAFLGALALWGYVTVQETVPEGLTMGSFAPEFTLTDLDGNPVALEDFRGTPVVLRFSSRTCAFCYDDFDTLAAFQQARAGELQVIAVELNAPASLVRDVVAGRNRGYPVVVDATGEVAERYRLSSIPHLYFINGEGRLVGRVAGELAEVDVDAHVARLFQPGAALTADLEAEVRAIAERVRCQECRGLSVWESNVESAWDMKREIWERVEAGETREEILADLVDRYGVWILMRPPARGGFLAAYLVPFVFVGIGGVIVYRVITGRRRPAEVPDPAGDEGVDPELEARVQERLKDYL